MDTKKYKKHAYLIICHNHFSQLGTLLGLLDDPRNDIYIHVDQKVDEFPRQMLNEKLRYAHIYYIDRLSIRYDAYFNIRFYNVRWSAINMAKLIKR